MSRILGRGMDSPSDHHSVEMQPSVPPRWSAGSAHDRQANAYETLDGDRSSFMNSPGNRSQRSMREPSSPPAQHSYVSGSIIAPYAYPPPPPPPPQSYSPMYTAAPGGAAASPVPHDVLEPGTAQVCFREVLKDGYDSFFTFSLVAWQHHARMHTSMHSLSHTRTVCASLTQVTGCLRPLPRFVFLQGAIESI